MWEYDIYECSPFSEFMVFTIENITTCIRPRYISSETLWDTMVRLFDTINTYILD